MEWTKYKVGVLSDNPKWTNDDCVPFTKVAHVTHINNAVNILNQGLLRPQLVYDESKLQTRRTLVNWFSPNHWTTGFRYGSVAFYFDWAKLIKDKKIYWVETIGYKIPACRLLISDKDYSSDSDFLPYDPTTGDGPWWYDVLSDRHYRNGKICLELMLESEVSLSDCNATQFVQHHRSYCCIDPGGCPESNMNDTEAGALFVAGVVSRELITEPLHMVTAEGDLKKAGNSLYAACNHLQITCQRHPASGAITAEDHTSSALARAYLAAFYRRNDQEQKSLAALFSAPAELQKSVYALTCHSFGLEEIKPF